MRDLPGRRDIDPPADGLQGKLSGNVPDSARQRLGRLPPEHPSSPRYRVPRAAADGKADAASPRDGDIAAARDKRGLPFSGRARRSRGAAPGQPDQDTRPRTATGPRDQRGSADKRGSEPGRSPAAGAPQRYKSPYRPWFASRGEGPPWFADGAGTGEARTP